MTITTPAKQAGVIHAGHHHSAQSANQEWMDYEFSDWSSQWMTACFGPVISADVTERNHRFLEEALELVQAKGCTASEAHQLVDYVFNRPIGDPFQELGGIMVMLEALANASDLNMDEAAETKLLRVWHLIDKPRLSRGGICSQGAGSQ
jgi:hypothetical protein